MIARGEVLVPGDKSITHRALMVAALSDGRCVFTSPLAAGDTRATAAALRALGIDVSPLSDKRVAVTGAGMKPFRAPSRPLACRNSGTTARLLLGLLAGHPFEAKLTGDRSLSRRPMARVTEPLRKMGAAIMAAEGERLPMAIHGGGLRPLDWTSPVASAQVKSCVLFAGLLAAGETRVIEPEPTRDHTERMLSAAGADVSRDGDAVVVRPVERLEPGSIAVPADISSAAFFLVAALLVPGSEVSLAGVGLNPTRTGLLAILRRMGAEIEVEVEGERGGEPIGRVHARPSPLHGVEVGGAEVPLAIDELPLVALAACFAEGTTTIRDAAELRRKESDRIATVTAALTALGGDVEATEDGMVINGTEGLRGGMIDSHGDHRIAMLGAVAGLASRGGVEVANMEAAAVSYPGFEADLASLVGPDRGPGAAH